MGKLKDELVNGQETWVDSEHHEESFEPDPVYDESIGNLATALAAAQGELEDAHKDKQGYGYSYADLSSVLSIARPVLSKHGLSVVQLLGGAGDEVTITTILMHKSGESIRTVSSMPVHQGKGMTHAQSVGAITTYLRRYSLSAMVGITQTDNDAGKVSETPDTKEFKQEYQRREAKPKPDPAVIKALNACEDLQTLAEMWKKLTKEQHALYEPVKDQRKTELQTQQADKEQASL